MIYDRGWVEKGARKNVSLWENDFDTSTTLACKVEGPVRPGRGITF